MHMVGGKRVETSRPLSESQIPSASVHCYLSILPFSLSVIDCVPLLLVPLKSETSLTPYIAFFSFANGHYQSNSAHCQPVHRQRLSPAVNQRCHLLSIMGNLRRGVLPAANQRPIVPTSLTIALALGGAKPRRVSFDGNGPSEPFRRWILDTEKVWRPPRRIATSFRLSPF